MILEELIAMAPGNFVQMIVEYEINRKEFNENCTIFDIDILSVEAFSEAGKKLDFINISMIEREGFFRGQIVKRAHEIELNKGLQ